MCPVVYRSPGRLPFPEPLNTLIGRGAHEGRLLPLLRRSDQAQRQGMIEGGGELAAGGRPAQPPGADVGQSARRRCSGGATLIRGTRGRRARSSPRCRPTRTSTSCSASTPPRRRARTGGRRGATGPRGRTSTAGTRTRSGWINGLKRMFYRDTHFVL